MRLAARPPKGGYTYGLKRAEILSAQANGLTLLLLSAWLAYEAVRRLIEPPAVTGGLVLGTALVGVVINLAAAWLMSKANRTSLNVEGAFQHILTDLYAFIATAIAGLVMVVTGFARADAIASLVVVALMLKAGLGLVRESGRIFLEAAPTGLSPDAIGKALAGRPHVEEVHDLHIWQITSGMPAASGHVLVAPGQDCHAVRQDLEEVLEHDYKITHTTLQIDHTPDPLLAVQGADGSAADQHCDESHGPIHRPSMKRPPMSEPRTELGQVAEDQDLCAIAFSSLVCAGTGAETGAAVPTPNRATARDRMLTRRMVTGTFLMLTRDLSARARARFPGDGVLFLPTQVPSTAPDLHTSDILTSNAATLAVNVSGGNRCR
jgi:cobalt-zinc-cadmium efflux system protein